MNTHTFSVTAEGLSLQLDGENDMGDHTENPAPAIDDRGAASLAARPLGEVDLLTQCEIWRAMDFAAPRQCDCGREGR